MLLVSNPEPDPFDEAIAKKIEMIIMKGMKRIKNPFKVGAT